MQTTLDYNVKVTIIPCAFKYFQSHLFRSKCIVEFGKPYQASDEMIKQFQSSQDKKTSIA